MPHRPERENIGREASIKGFANEHIVVGLLMQKYHNVSLVDLPLSSYDVVLVRKIDGADDFIRIQVKTATNNVSFTGGSRGGQDRSFNSVENISKAYTHTIDTSDVVCGVHKNHNESFDLFFIPTILIEKLGQKSISLSRIAELKNYEFLDNCKDREWVLKKGRELRLIRIS